jgi:hypothetical protein
VKRCRLGWLVLSLLACRVEDVSPVGKRCDDAHPCPDGLICSVFTGTCGTSSGCPYLSEETVTCPRRHLYLAPGGADTANGLSAASPKRNLSAFSLQQGDWIHLAAGAYPVSLQPTVSGAADCPITLSGDPTGASILQAPLIPRGSHWRWEDLSVQAAAAAHAIDVSGTEDVRFIRFHVSKTGSGAGVLGNDFWLTGPGCQNCWIIDSTFDDVNSHALFANEVSTGLVFVGNTAKGDIDFSIQINSPAAVVEANDFTGSFGTSAVVFALAAVGTGIARRNVFHDLGNSGDFVVTGAAILENNSFLRMGGSWRVADRGVLRNNVVVQAPGGLAIAPPSGSGYNLFDNVPTPYPGASPLPTDMVGSAQLDTNNVPTEGSPAVDAADPSTPVPSGGGSRADVGARERGASPLPDGRYCTPGM